MAPCRYTVFRTPLGWSGVAVTDEGVRAVVLPKGSRSAVQRELEAACCAAAACPARVRRDRVVDLERIVTDLQRYFSGLPVVFDHPLDLEGHTVFRRAVWRAARSIPYGETRSYGWIARSIGQARAARAVGQAMGANPVPLIVP